MELVIGRKKHKVLIDDEDWELVKHYRISVRDGYVYLTRQANCKHVEMAMHRFLMGAERGEIVDHIDGNRANNTRANLRIVTMAENAMNRGMSKKNKTGVTGVFWNKWRKSYTARVSIANVKYYLGQFHSLSAAAAAVEEKARSLRGEYHRSSSEVLERQPVVEDTSSRQLNLFEDMQT